MKYFNFIYFAAFLIILLIENLFPERNFSYNKIRHYIRNASLAIFSMIITGVFGLIFSLTTFLISSKNVFGISNVLKNHILISYVLGFLLLDVWMYLWHRANHKIRILWRIHRVHHNDPSMDVSTIFRFHPAEIAISYIFNIFVIIIFGLNISHIIIYRLIFHINVAVHHSNIRIPLKLDNFLRFFIVTPNMHRIHHSTYHIETDSNYSSVLSVWDRLFGSYIQSDVKKIKFGLTKYLGSKYQTVKGMLTLPLIN